MNKIDLNELKARVSLELLFERDGHKLVNASGMKKCCCPFHMEKTPSCCVYPDNHFFCFGCHASGTVIDYTMLRYGFNFKEAVQHLESKVGPIPSEPFKPFVAPVNRETPPLSGAEAMISKWNTETYLDSLVSLSLQLCVSVDSLRSLDCVWAKEHKAWAFPMRDDRGSAVGIRLRALPGKKWAVKGSKEGLFYGPLLVRNTTWICEGPTDTSAGITLGLNIIGRPSCQGAVDYTVKRLQRLECREAIVISDNDAPGLKGSERLESRLPCRYREVVLPCKDLREFVKLGGTRQLLESMASKQLPRRSPLK